MGEWWGERERGEEDVYISTEENYSYHASS
jgi:hypothetical protein